MSPLQLLHRSHTCSMKFAGENDGHDEQHTFPTALHANFQGIDMAELTPGYELHAQACIIKSLFSLGEPSR